MPETASPEIVWLALTCLLTALMWVPYILVHLAETGPVRAVVNPALDTTPAAAWAARAKKAHANAVENLAVFAPLALAVAVTGSGTALTAGSCAVYFFARAVHYPVAALAVPVLRTVAFVVGSVCQVLLALTLLGVV